MTSLTEQFRLLAEELKSTQVEDPIGIKEACAYLQLHEQTLYKYIRTGKIPAKFVHRLGRNVYFFKSELYQLLKSQ